MFFRKKNDNQIINSEKEASEAIIIPLYLNQRIVYDTLAILNDGFTELYNVSNSNSAEYKNEANISGELNIKGNPLTLMSAKLGTDLSLDTDKFEKKNEEFTKIHTPTSLFTKVYNYLIDKNQIIKLTTADCLDNIQTSDFVEFKSNLVINTIEEGFRKALKMASIGELFCGFGENVGENKNNKKTLANAKENLTKLTKYLDFENEKTKYMLGQIENRKIIVKIDRENIINADYDQISQGNFRIIGKILEVVESGKTINLNRESVIGLIKKETLQPIKTALDDMKNTMFENEDIVDEIEGPTIIVIPIVIGV